MKGSFIGDTDNTNGYGNSVNLCFFKLFLKMSELNSNNLVIFAEGVIAGIFLVFLWNKLGRSKTVNHKASEGEIVYDYIPDRNSGDNKLVLLVRTDLKMGKGKVAAQCSHAAVLAHELSRKKAPDIFADWKRNGQPKIVLKVNSEEEMMELGEQARKLNLLVSIVQDAGRTQVASGSRTVLAIGPGSEALINQVTGYLSLY